MRKAVLIIHGFVGCLGDNEYLMNYLTFDRKFDVFSRTLPGHYDDETYQKVEYTEWIKFADLLVSDLISHSMGGVLAGYLASKYKEIKKVVFINAAYNYLNLKQNKIDILKNRDYKDYIEVFDRVLHTSIPFFLEFVKLIKEYHDNLEKVSCDALVLQSELDQVVPIENGLEIINKLNSKNKYLTYLQKERHMVFGGSLKDIERKEILSEYVRLFLIGGLKWKKIWKEKI